MSIPWQAFVRENRMNPKKVEAGDAIEGGLKNEMFTKIGEKGMFASIVTEDDKVSEIRVVRFGKKKKDQ